MTNDSTRLPDGLGESTVERIRDEEPDPDYEYERAMEEEAEKMELWEQEAKAVCGVEE